MEQEGIPKYIQVIRLFKPGQHLTYGQVTRLALDHFGHWYKENPYRSMDKMLRSALGSYSSIVTKGDRITIDTTKALALADDLYPMEAYFKPQSPSITNNYILYLKVLIFSLPIALLTILFIFIDKPEKKIETLLRKNRETKVKVPISESLKTEYRNLQVDFPLPFDFPSGEVISPLREETAATIANLSPDFVKVTSNSIVGIFPYLEEPMWLVDHDNFYHPVRLGSRVIFPNRAGTVINVDQDKLTYVSRSGTIDQYMRPRITSLGIESTGRKTILFPQPERGNWEGLSAFFNVQISAGVGNISGTFPPWEDLSKLRQLLVKTRIRNYQGFYGNPVSYRGSVQDLIQKLMTTYPGSYDVVVSKELVWYRGEPLEQLFQFLNLSTELDNGTLKIWGPPTKEL